MMDERRARFDALCRAYLSLAGVRDSETIGTYNEKPLHKILKRTVTSDESCFEKRIGSYVADVCEEGSITEIQTGSFYPLAPKLTYFLKETQKDVTVVHPITEELTIVRVDPETGEVLRRAKSPKKGRVRDVLPELWYLRDVFPSERLTVAVPLLRAEEYRYSERQRYRKEGKYDAQFFPLGMLSWVELHTLDDVLALLPDTLRTEDGFTAEQFGKAMGLPKGRRRAVALLFLCEKGICTREKKGRSFLYRITLKS